MTTKRYYKLSLLLPFIVPIIFYPFTVYHTPTVNNYSIINIASTIGMWSFFAILYGGIPYLILATGMLLFISKNTSSLVHKTFYFLPIIFIPVFSISWLLFFGIMDGTWELWQEGTVKGALNFTYGFGMWILAVGYSYIALIQGGYWLFKNYGKSKGSNRRVRGQIFILDTHNYFQG